MARIGQRALGRYRTKAVAGRCPNPTRQPGVIGLVKVGQQNVRTESRAETG